MDLKECFEDLIKDMHSAEKQLLGALPQMAKMANNVELKNAFETHREQTEGHVMRLEKVAEICGFQATGVLCKGMQGLITEAKEDMEGLSPGAGHDALMIMLAQKNEHYEISGYGSAVEWAKTLGREDCAEYLQETLDEEIETDKLLTSIAKRVNQEAAGTTVANRRGDDDMGERTSVR